MAARTAALRATQADVDEQPRCWLHLKFRCWRRLFKRCDNVRLTAMTHCWPWRLCLKPLKPLPAMGRNGASRSRNLQTVANITKDTAVTINYKIHELLFAGGVAVKLLDKGDVAYLHGGYDNIFAKVEAALDGKQRRYRDRGPGCGGRLRRARRKPQAHHSQGRFPAGVKGSQLRGTNDQGHRPRSTTW